MQGDNKTDALPNPMHTQPPRPNPMHTQPPKPNPMHATERKPDAPAGVLGGASPDVIAAASEAHARQQARAPAAGMKVWAVRPVNPQLPPFHFSNTPGMMLIAAPSEDHARRLASLEAGHDEYADHELVTCVEFKPDRAMILTRDMRS